jgi:hypothetical protein
MKNLLTLLSIVLVFLAVGAFLLTGRLASSDIKKAARLAASGDCDKAVSNYASAVIAMTDSRNVPYVPDRAQALNLNPQTWQKPIAEFVEWAKAYKSVPANLAPALDAIDRCTTSVIHENFIYAVKTRKVGLDEYKTAWENALCPEKASGGSVSVPAIEKAYSSGLSLMSVSGNSIYSYDLHFINRENGKQTNVFIDCDKVSSFPVKPGRYTVVMSSKTMFQGGKAWVSTKEAAPFYVPDSVMIIASYLRTEVHREK